MSDATVDCITTVCQAVKQVLPRPKVTCVFYGYQFSNMPRAQLNAHYALRRLLSSPAVDMIASPHSYSYRGEGGYHSPQAIADSIRLAGKLHIDEIDCKTVWTPTSVTWKTHISQPKTIPATIEMMKKDASYQLASGTAQWWMDLTDQGWFEAPEVVEPIRKLKAIEERLETLDRHPFAEIAFVVSQRSMMFQVPREGLHNATMKFFRNWHLSRMGAPFEQIMIEDLERPDIPAYKLYIMANTFYLTTEQRILLESVIKRDKATVLWIYAPGFLDEGSANLENMHTLTGISLGQENISGELNVTITNYDHPITKDLPKNYAYGTGINREQYLQPPKTQYLPYTASINPHFYSNDPKAIVLGFTHYINKPGLVVKDIGSWRSIYSSAPLLPWQLMRNIARFANVHIYNDQGDMVWANNHFISLYSQSDGKHIVYFPGPCNVEDAYDNRMLAQNCTSVEFEMKKWETKLLFLIYYVL